MVTNLIVVFQEEEAETEEEEYQFPRETTTR
jgi:hypothetical protein